MKAWEYVADKMARRVGVVVFIVQVVVNERRTAPDDSRFSISIGGLAISPPKYML